MSLIICDFRNSDGSGIFVMMARIFLITLFCWIGFSLNAQSLHVDVASEAAILLNAETGKVLFGKNKDEIRYPASITKVATALYILKMYESRMDEKVVAKREALASITPQAKKQCNYRCPAYWIDTDGTHIGIKTSEEFTLRTLFTAMLVSSANDAANVMAEHLEGSVPKFMEKLNKFLKDLGCKNTTFQNPHGLHHPQHKSTAQDMAIIAKAAMQYPLFRQTVALTHFVCPRTNLCEERYLTQTNHLLRHGPYYYKKAIGVKTGFTSQAGKTLIAAAQTTERSLIAIVLGSPTTQDRYLDVTKMFEKSFNEKKLRYSLLAAGVQKLKVKVSGGKTPLRTYLKEPLNYDFYPSEQSEVKAKIVWGLPQLPIQQHQCVGEAIAYDSHQKIVARTAVYALETVKPTLYYQIKSKISHNNSLLKILCGIGGGLVLLIFWRQYNNKNRRKRSV